MSTNNKSQIRRFIEAVNTGDAPDWIDPEIKSKIETNRHPFAKNPGWPRQKPPRREGPPYAEHEDRADTYAELVSSYVYPEIVKKVQRYTGQNVHNLGPGGLMRILFNALQRVQKLEKAHVRELERLAVELVLNLPEFKDAKEAVEAGELRIDAKIVSNEVITQKIKQKIDQEKEAEEEEENRVQLDPEEDDEEQAQRLGLNVPEIRSEFDLEANKRRLINLMIQGAAVNKNYAYHLISDELNHISPDLLNLYGILMSTGELAYWMLPEQSYRSAASQGIGAAGMEHIDHEGNTYVIKAYGIVFPVLVQEIVKGLYEFLSHDEDVPGETRKYVYGKVDTLANERWDIMKGPGVWRHLVHLVNELDAADILPRIFRYIAKLPAGQFTSVIKEILSETPTGKNFLRNLIREIREEIE